jgi:signal transduction histidine kinase
VAITLASETLLLGPAGSGGTSAATVVFVVAQLIALGWLGTMWWGWWARWRTEVRLIRLAKEMHDVSSPDALPSALRAVLRDPGLRLCYWAPGRQSFVDPWGDPVTRPEPAADQQSTTVSRNGEPIALIVHSKRVDGSRLDRAMRPALRLAVQNQQLRAAATAELAELAASRTSVVERRQAERSRLERNLHDGAQQHAFSLALLLGALLGQCGDTDRALVARAQALTQELLDELRMVAHGIHPTVLTDAGLEGAFRDLAERSDILPVTVATVPKGRYPATVEAAAYLVVRELLADAARRGAGQATVNGSAQNGVLRASVEDDAPDPAGPVPIDLADQVLALGGRLVAGRTSGASRAEVVLPCGS